uniref:cyclin-D1-binding protein 1 homolog n=1 Tax=Centroberyx gerrardi TaxID=166262 RepID=UPI003AAA6B03
VSLRRQVRDATVEVLEGVAQLVEVILSSPLQSLSQEQLTSTGGVWSACDQFTHLPRDNKAAVLLVLSSHIGVVKDAIEEVEQALSEAQDPYSDILDDDLDGDEPRGNQDTYWSEQDRRVIGPCQGLMKASAASLRKLTSAVRAKGDVTTHQNLAQLDDLADITKDISPSVDDLALCLYPPMDYSGVESNASKLAALLKKVLEIIRSSHVCGESELSWVQFLEGAVDHNLQKARDLIQQGS